MATTDEQEQVARIKRMQEETRKFVAEQHALIARDARTAWTFPVIGMIIGAALFGAGAAFMKLVG